VVVIVQVLADVLFVANVELVKVSTTPALLHLKGVISKSCPSKYKSKNLSVPRATYLLPLVSTKACCFLATPTIESLSNDCQPPTFSGRPYLNLTLSESTHLPSAPTLVSCLSIPGANLI